MCHLDAVAVLAGGRTDCQRIRAQSGRLSSEGGRGVVGATVPTALGAEAATECPLRPREAQSAWQPQPTWTVG